MQPEVCRSRHTKIRDNTIETSEMQSCNGVLQPFPTSAAVVKSSAISVGGFGITRATKNKGFENIREPFHYHQQKKQYMI